MEISNLWIPKEIVNIVDKYYSWKPIFNKSLEIIKKIDKPDYNLMREFYRLRYCNICGNCYGSLDDYSEYTRDQYCICNFPRRISFKKESILNNKQFQNRMLSAIFELTDFI